MKNNRIDFQMLVRKKIRKSKVIAICALFCALGVVFMYAGAILEVLDISSAVLASMLCAIIYYEIGGLYPWLVYAVTGILSLLLLPGKFGALLYVFMAGYYPMLKINLERFKNRVIQWTAKILLFNIATSALILLIRLVLFTQSLTSAYIIALYIIGNFTFVVYDIALTLLVRLYYIKLRKQLRIDKLLK